MRALKVKPFTLILLCLSISFLILAPNFLLKRIGYFNSTDPIAIDQPAWTGIISLWDVPYVEAGKGSINRWLNKYIHDFEKQNPGVYIDVRNLNSERLTMYFSSNIDPDISPDIVSLGIYKLNIPLDMLINLQPYFSENELSSLHVNAYDRVMIDNKMIGVPWMMGTYGLFLNNAYLQNSNITIDKEQLDFRTLDEIARAISYEKKVNRKIVDYYGFCSYSTMNSKPLLSMIFQDESKISEGSGYNIIHGWSKMGKIFPPDMANLSYPKAFNIFAVEKRSGIFLGSSKLVFDIRRLQETGKGIEFTAYPIPLETDMGLYQDQISAFGVLNGSSDDKTKLCVFFLKGLLDIKYQQSLKELGMFSVINGYELYNDDEAMKVLEASLVKANKNPFGYNSSKVDQFWSDFTSSLKME